jgi:hypothetical protein
LLLFFFKLNLNNVFPPLGTALFKGERCYRDEFWYCSSKEDDICQKMFQMQDSGKHLASGALGWVLHHPLRLGRSVKGVGGAGQSRLAHFFSPWSFPWTPHLFQTELLGPEITVTMSS